MVVVLIITGIWGITISATRIIPFEQIIYTKMFAIGGGRLIISNQGYRDDGE